MARRTGSRSKQTARHGDPVKLATLLGAQTKHPGRAQKSKAASGEAIHWRIRLLIVSLALLALGLWGIWREFLCSRKLKL